VSQPETRTSCRRRRCGPKVDAVPGQRGQRGRATTAWFPGFGAGKTQTAISDRPRVGNSGRTVEPESSKTLDISRKKVAPQVGLESASAKATAGQAYAPSRFALRRDLAEARRGRETDPQASEGGQPPVNSRVTLVLLPVAASCQRLLERALPQRGQQVAHLPRGARSCCELPRVVARKRREKGKVVAGGAEGRPWAFLAR
jgi:hypothetical protein